jgi:hypothetical protein
MPSVKSFCRLFCLQTICSKRFKAGLLTIDQVSQKIIADTDYLKGLDQQGVDRFVAFVGTLVNKDRQTQDVLISSFIYNFIYNEIGKKDYPNAFYFNGKIELAGNIFSIFNQKRNDGGVVTSPERTIFNIPYAQFVKFDFDFRKYFKFGNNTLALRQFVESEFRTETLQICLLSVLISTVDRMTSELGFLSED